MNPRILGGAISVCVRDGEYPVRLAILDQISLTLYKGTDIDRMLYKAERKHPDTRDLHYEAGNVPDGETRDDTTNEHASEVVRAGLHRAAPQCNNTSELNNSKHISTP